MSQPAEPIGLTEMIERVKQDLLAANAPSGDDAPMFFVESVELELKVVAQSEAGAGLKIGVIPFSPIKGEAEMKAGVSYENTHTVKVKLSPLYDKEKVLAFRALYAPEEEAASLKASAIALTKGSNDVGPKS